MNAADPLVVRAFDDAASRYDRTGAALADPVARRLVELAGLARGHRVLDAGCGAGAVLVRAARVVRPGAVTGIDLSARMLKRAQAASRALANVRVRLADAASPPFAPGSFDAVLASLVLYLLADPGAALRRWHDLLTPGGTLALSWHLAPDPRWVAVYAAVDRYATGATGNPGLDSYLGRLGGRRQVEDLLRRCGYTEVTTTAGAIEVRYRGPRHWWDTAWSDAPRLAWQQIPTTTRDAARRDAFTLLDQLREPGGSLLHRPQIGYAAARRPPAPP